MSVSCPFCSYIMAHKENVFGTLCDSCKAYIPPLLMPNVVKEADKRLLEQQSIIRQHLKKILGEQNGNQVEQKS